MTVHGSRPVEHMSAEPVEDSPPDDWAILVRPRHSRRDYVRQIVIDTALVVAVLAIIALLS